MPEEDLYEIIPMDPLHKLKERGEELEREIEGIKRVLRDTVAISKLHASADELVDRMIDMIKVSQDMVEAVVKSNQLLSAQLQRSLDEMVKSNKEFTGKLDNLLGMWGKPPAEEIRPALPAGTGELKLALENLASKLDEVVQTNKEMAHKTSELQESMSTITDELRTQVKKMRAPAPSLPSPPRLVPPRPVFPSAPLPPAPPRPRAEEEL